MKLSASGKKPAPSLSFLAVFGAMLFAVINFMPGVGDRATEDTPPGPEQAIAKAEAERIARAFVATMETKQVAETAYVLVSHDTRKVMSGYLARFNLEKTYAVQYADPYPLDYFKADVRTGSARYYVYVHLFKPEAIGWQKQSNASPAPPEQAERLAIRYLQDKGLNPQGFEKSSPRAGEWVFVDKSKQVGDAALHHVVRVRGGEVTGYEAYFEPPLFHRKWQERQDLSALLLTLAFFGLLFGISIAAAIMAIAGRKTASFARGAILTAVFGAFMTIDYFNRQPALIALAGDRFVSAAEMVVEAVFSLGLEALWVAGLYFTFVAGENLCRRLGWNVWPHWRSPEFGKETVASMKRGYLLALFMLGAQALVLFIAEVHFGMWWVNDPLQSVLNLSVPALQPLGAWSAAIQEEAVFRLFGVAVAYRVFRSKLAAVLLPSLIWSLGHAAYPIYPFYTRVWEVTLFGLVLGFAFLRYGFMTVVFAHAIVNTVLMGLQLLQIETSALHVSAALGYAVLPAAIAFALRALNRRFRRDSSPPGSPPPGSWGPAPKS